MSAFDRELVGFRYVELQHGDTLRRVALRELGDDRRWPELAWINNLVPPYITDDRDVANDRVLLTGGLIAVPAAKPTATAITDPAAVFGSDCEIRNGMLEADASGDVAIVSGLPNLHQQLRHRINTDKGNLAGHPEYGCSIRRMLGVVNGPTAALLAARYVKSALLSDDRVSVVRRSAGEAAGDSIRVRSEFEPVAGKTVDFEVSV